MIAWLNLRHNISQRHEAFVAGLRALGYEVRELMQNPSLRPGRQDILVTWNRLLHGQRAALEFEFVDRPVIVAENASWGNDAFGGGWLSLCKGHHNRAAGVVAGGPERWDSLGVELAPWRTAGELVILPQRGIGPPGVAMPHDWPARALYKHGGRIRKHPGQAEGVPLEQDLRNCGRVITWGSGAAIKALMMGVPVRSDMPGWIGEQDNTDEGRLAMFRRLAWAQWRLDEIATGAPFARLLS